MKGQTNAKAIISNAEKLYISLTTDQTDHSAIIGAVVTITYESTNNSYTYDGSTISVEIPADVTYTITFGAVVGYNAPASQSYTSQAFYSHNVSAIYTKALYKLTTIRIDQTLSDPDSMITRIVDGGGIEAIRANSHRYVGDYSFQLNAMMLKQLDDNDSTYFADGTSATEYISGAQALGELFNKCNSVWMKLPQFWYKCTQYDTDKWDFSVAYGGQPDNTYKEWDGKDLIAVYKACYHVYEAITPELRSFSGQQPLKNVTRDTFKTYASNFSDFTGTNGITLIKWKHHCMMAMLFYAYYGTTNSQNVCGDGQSASSSETGGSNSYGMQDSVAGIGSTVNFWGLEDWWGFKYEYMDNIQCISESWTVTEDDGSTRTIGTQPTSSGVIRKMVFGENLDLMPTAVWGQSETSKGFCDSFIRLSSIAYQTRNISRSNESNNATAGISFLDSQYEEGSTSSYHTTRLAYRGEYVILD